MPSPITLTVFLFVTAVCLVAEAVRAIRWQNRKRFWRFLGAGVPIAILACFALWVSVRNPSADEP